METKTVIVINIKIILIQNKVLHCLGVITKLSITIVMVK